MPLRLSRRGDDDRSFVQRVLVATKGNRAQAAQILKIDPKTLRAKLKKYDGGGADDVICGGPG